MVKPAIVIAYDGSDLAQEAVRRAAELFPGSPAVVVTVWEPGLGAVTTMSAGFDMTGPFPGRFDPALVMDVDRAVEERAAVIAEAGASLGRSLGLEAEAHAIADELKVGETVADLADQRPAAAIVVGSRGISGLRSHLLGSTSRDILARTGRPVVVVRGNRNP